MTRDAEGASSAAMRESSVVRLSVIPSAKQSWAGSPDRLANGSTTIERCPACAGFIERPPRKNQPLKPAKRTRAATTAANGTKPKRSVGAGRVEPSAGIACGGSGSAEEAWRSARCSGLFWLPESWSGRTPSSCEALTAAEAFRSFGAAFVRPSNRYPSPGTVTMRRGSFGSDSTLLATKSADQNVHAPVEWLEASIGHGVQQSVPGDDPPGAGDQHAQNCELAARERNPPAGFVHKRLGVKIEDEARETHNRRRFGRRRGDIRSGNIAHWRPSKSRECNFSTPVGPLFTSRLRPRHLPFTRSV